MGYEVLKAAFIRLVEERPLKKSPSAVMILLH